LVLLQLIVIEPVPDAPVGIVPSNVAVGQGIIVAAVVNVVALVAQPVAGPLLLVGTTYQLYVVLKFNALPEGTV
jgi:hypothetical protein